MSETDINEAVTVWAFFDHGIFPIAMNWRRQIVKFKKTIFTTSKMVGKIKLINLICASETANFELEFDSGSFLWKLKKIMPQ